MVIRRGDLYWVAPTTAATPGEVPDERRPVLIVQAQPYNDSRLPTVLAVAISSNTRLAALPGSVFLPAAVSGLPVDAVVDVTEVMTIERSALDGPIGRAPLDEMRAVDDGLRIVLGLG
jgi:mRNA interferase MazF